MGNATANCVCLVGFARALWLLLAVALGGSLVAQDATIERTGKVVRIVFHPGDLTLGTGDRMADQALAAAEAFWPTLQKMLPVRTAEPLPVHLYRIEKEFRAAELGSALRYLREECVDKAGVGHVLFGNAQSANELDTIGLPAPVLDRLRWVVAEQAIAPLVPANDEGGWLRTIAVVGAVEAASNPEQEPGVDIAFDARRLLLYYKLQAKEVLTLDSLLAMDMACADRAAWDFTLACCTVAAQHLGTSGSGWARKLLGKQRESKGQTTPYRRRKQAVEGVLGTDWTKTEERFRRTYQSIAPLWEVTDPLFVPGPKRSLLLGTPTVSAMVTGVAPPPAGDYVIHGRAQYDADADAREVVFRIEVGYGGKEMLGAHFSIDETRIATWSDAKNQWLHKVVFDTERPLGQPFEFRVEVTKTELRVLVPGTAPLVYAHGGVETHTLWRFASRGGILWLDPIRIEPLVTPKK